MSILFNLLQDRYYYIKKERSQPGRRKESKELRGKGKGVVYDIKSLSNSREKKPQQGLEVVREWAKRIGIEENIPGMRKSKYKGPGPECVRFEERQGGQFSRSRVSWRGGSSESRAIRASGPWLKGETPRKCLSSKRYEISRELREKEREVGAKLSSGRERSQGGQGQGQRCSGTGQSERDQEEQICPLWSS